MLPKCLCILYCGNLFDSDLSHSDLIMLLSFKSLLNHKQKYIENNLVTHFRKTNKNSDQ
jgi:hypothetical protein